VDGGGAGVLFEMKSRYGRAITTALTRRNAMEFVTVPKLSVVMRKSYGLAVSNRGAGGNSDEVACWITAEVSFMKPEFGAQIAYRTFGASPDNPEEFKEAVATMNKGTTPYDMAGIYTAHDVIDPRDAREWLIRMLEVHRLRMSGGVRQHLMRTWPTSYGKKTPRNTLPLLRATWGCELCHRRSRE
jgi:hypothetical protein